MNIRDKLKFIDEIGKTHSQRREIQSKKIPLENVIPGEEYKSSFVITSQYHLDHAHGKMGLGEVLKISPEYFQLAGKDESLIDLDLKKTLFFDTETTGLSGGSGTYIFLAGFGFFENEKFQIKQFFLRHPGEERAMLNAIAELFSERDKLVSFNGKSFDWPLLKSRMIFHRIWRDIREPVHLDLLHAARRVWKKSLPDCSLSSLEKSILNIQRDGDVPSWEIPEIYFRFLREGDPNPLLPVLYHNKIDILSLVSLTGRLYQIHREPVTEANSVTELLSLASYYEKNNYLTNAMKVYRAILADSPPSKLKTHVQIRLAACLKRNGEIHQASEIWNDIIGSENFVFEAYEELAKHHEHRTKDINKARQIVLSALSTLEIKEQLHPSFEYRQMIKSMKYRLNRLTQKLSK